MGLCGPQLLFVLFVVLYISHIICSWCYSIYVLVVHFIVKLHMCYSIYLLVLFYIFVILYVAYALCVFLSFFLMRGTVTNYLPTMYVCHASKGK